MKFTWFIYRQYSIANFFQLINSLNNWRKNCLRLIHFMSSHQRKNDEMNKKLTKKPRKKYLFLFAAQNSLKFTELIYFSLWVFIAFFTKISIEKSNENQFCYTIIKSCFNFVCVLSFHLCAVQFLLFYLHFYLIFHHRNSNIFIAINSIETVAHETEKIYKINKCQKKKKNVSFFSR